MKNLKPARAAGMNPEVVQTCFKGVTGCKIHLYMLFEHTCVLDVCVHIHPIMIKIHPVFLKKIQINNNPFLKSSRSQLLVGVTSHRPRPIP